jgi:hypothetical protein
VTEEKTGLFRVTVRRIDGSAHSGKEHSHVVTQYLESGPETVLRWYTPVAEVKPT